MRDGGQGWEADFPLREEVEDYAGRMRSFVINVWRWGLRVQAYFLLLTDVYPPFALT